jgi:hypothetical protein
MKLKTVVISSKGSGRGDKRNKKKAQKAKKYFLKE